MTVPGADPGRDGIRCMLMRGGTSKGAFFLADDLPADDDVRDDLLLRIMGSPDRAQIDGLGGAHPLTSKVAVVAASPLTDVDIDYLFLQVGIDEPVVADLQTCGNLLAGVGPFALERGLLSAPGEECTVRIRLRNTGGVATVTFKTQDGAPAYDGDTAIDGVPGTASPVLIDLAGGARPLLPTGQASEEIDGHRVTLIDNGMPVVLLRAEEFAVGGDEDPVDLEQRADLGAQLERIRLEAGRLMGLGDVAAQTVPKLILLSAPTAGGTVSTRAFIPTRVHTSIGVLMAASVAAGIRIPGAVGSDLARLEADAVGTDIEHPSGTFRAEVTVAQDEQGRWQASSRSIRTARKIFDGTVYPRPRP